MNHLSVLDSRSKEWQLAKKEWNLKEPIGREQIQSRTQSVSVFDPVLAELFYGWYCPDGGSILDPFAGGPTRGYVAQQLGYTYTGIDISETQVKANQYYGVNCILGDSETMLPTVDKHDLIFTCPPYHDLEVYTNEVNDLSNMDWDQFSLKYSNIFQQCYDRLYDNRFMVIVTSEIREPSLTRAYRPGYYRGLVPLTIKAAEEAGFHYYNDFVYLHSAERAAKQMNRLYRLNRKVPRTHQNVLVFVKGNPDLATLDIDRLHQGQRECIVDGIEYRTFREAAICIDPSLVASDIKWRCSSSYYPNYQK
jgi:DNA modification methylase